MKKKLRLVRRFVRSMFMLALVCVAVVFLFPEWCVRLVVMNLMPGVQCTVDEVRIRNGRVNMRSLRISDASFAMDVASAVVRRHGGRWQMQVASGTLALASAPASSPQRVAGTSSWTTLPVITIPLAVCASISNLAVSVAASPPLPAFEMLCHIDAVADSRLKTQAWATAAVFFAGQSNSMLRAILWQSGGETGIDLPGAAFDAAWTLKTMAPELTVKACPMQLRASAVAAPVSGTASLVYAICDLGATAASVSSKPRKLTLKNPRLSANARLKRKLTLPYVPRDPVGYLLARFDASLTARVDELRVDNLRFSNVVAVALVVSNHIELVAARSDVCGGTVSAAGTFERRKVKGKDAYRFLYSASVSVTNVDAGMVCRVFKMDTNRVEGVYNGMIAASGFGNRVISLKGDLRSSSPGTLFFPESQKYVAGMGDGLNKQVMTIKAEELRNYPYRDSSILLNYTPQDTSTVVRFEFKGEFDTYALPVIYYNRTWIDAIKLMVSFK